MQLKYTQYKLKLFLNNFFVENKKNHLKLYIFTNFIYKENGTSKIKMKKKQYFYKIYKKNKNYKF